MTSTCVACHSADVVLNVRATSGTSKRAHCGLSVSEPTHGMAAAINIAVLKDANRAG